MNTAVLKFILDQAYKAFPHSVFKFSVSHIVLKEGDTWQISLSQDKGDRQGPLFFCQGNGRDLDEAQQELLNSVRGQIAHARNHLKEQYEKNKNSFENQIANLQDALDSFETMKNLKPL